MMTVVDANLLLVILALVIGFAIGWWMFRRRRAGSDIRLDAESSARPYLDTPREPPAPVAAPPMEQAQRRPIRDGLDTEERRGLLDDGAAATRDMAGDILGVREHAAPAVAAPGGPTDDLQMLKGVGPKLAQKLNENGIMRFDQLAGLSATEVSMLDERLGAFRGRLARDRVVEQASYLARGDKDGFEAQFGKLGGA
jgi:predicted flap endonuclease-1-like 5' DNA nuclease